MKILTLSGWTQPADALLSLVPEAEALDYIDHAPDELRAPLPAYDAIIGWSLGGILARRLAQSGAVKARALISIAAPYQFVRDEHLHEAMPPETFEQFYANYRDDTARTVTRFHGLISKNDVRARDVRSQLAHHPRVHEAAVWLRWMDFLRDYSARHHDYSALPPTLIIHGAKDAIVPVAQAERLAEATGGETLILPEAGHAPHLHDAEQVRAVIAEFLRG